MKVRKDFTKNMETGLEQREYIGGEIASTLEIKLKRGRKETGAQSVKPQTQEIMGGGQRKHALCCRARFRNLLESTSNTVC